MNGVVKRLQSLLNRKVLWRWSRMRVSISLSVLSVLAVWVGEKEHLCADRWWLNIWQSCVVELHRTLLTEKSLHKYPNRKSRSHNNWTKKKKKKNKWINEWNPCPLWGQYNNCLTQVLERALLPNRPDVVSLCGWADQHHLDFVLVEGNEPQQ